MIAKIANTEIKEGIFEASKRRQKRVQTKVGNSTILPDTAELEETEW